MKKKISALLILCMFMVSGLYSDDLSTIISNNKIKKFLTAKESFYTTKDQDKEFTFADAKGKIEITANSLANEQTITVAQVEIDYDPARFNMMGDVYEFGPDGLVFDKPVKITLPYAEQAGVAEQFINIYYYNTVENYWEMMPKVSQNFEANTITVEIMHFSTYAPGDGSYTVNEGVTPNAAYFQNNNEVVDNYKGTLFINRTEIAIQGKGGLGLTLESGFSSDDYFMNNETELEEQEVMRGVYGSGYEKYGVYEIGKGWHWKLPFIINGMPDSYYQNGWRDLYLYLPSGSVFSLYYVMKDKCDENINTLYYDDFCRYYITNYSEDSGKHYYTKTIEFIKEKIVVSCNVELSGIFDDIIVMSNIKIYMPDGTIQFMEDSYKDHPVSKITAIKDVSLTNSISFTYDSLERIDKITESSGRIFGFTYTSSAMSVKMGTENLFSYTLSTNVVTAVRRLAADGTVLETTGYTYNPASIKITYPSGGFTNYDFATIDAGKAVYTKLVDDGINQQEVSFVHYFNRPVVKKVTIDDKNPSTFDKIRKYEYYDDCFTDELTAAGCVDIYPNDDHPVFIDRVFVYDGQSTATSPAYSSKTAYYYEYCWNHNNNSIYWDRLVGMEQSITSIWNGNDYSPKSGVFNKLIQITNDYWVPVSTGYCYNYTSTSLLTDATPKDYTVNFEYDWYGQVIMQSDSLGATTFYDYVYSHPAGIPFASLNYPDPVTFDQLATYTDTYQGIFVDDPYVSINYKSKCLGFGLVKGTAVVQGMAKTITFNLYSSYRRLAESKVNKSSYDNSLTEWLKTRFEYDSNGNLITIYDPDNYFTVLTYDSTYHAYINSDKRTITLPADSRYDEGMIITNNYTYDSRGRLKSRYSQKGTSEITDTVVYEYDDLNRVISAQTKPDANSTTVTGKKCYIYDDTVNTLTIYELYGDAGEENKTVKTFDGLDRLIDEKSYKYGSTTSFTQTGWKQYEYHPCFTDKVTKVITYKTFNSTTGTHILENIYDRQGRLIEEKSGGVTIRLTEYDDAANCYTVKSYTDEASYNQSRVTKNYNGTIKHEEQWSAISPASGTTADIKVSYTYDRAGNKISMTNPAGEVFYYKYNTLNQLEYILYPDGTTETTTYNKTGQPILFTDRKGQKIEYTYDSIGSLRTEKSKTSASVVESQNLTDYSVTGAASSVTQKDGAGVVAVKQEYTYDKKGNVSWFKQSVGGKSYEQNFSYYKNSSTKQMSFKAGTDTIRTFNYTINPLPLENKVVSTVKDAAVQFLSVSSTYWGGIYEIGYGSTSGAKTIYSYNTLLQPTGIVNGTNMNLGYAYDFQGNVKSWTNVTTRSFTYDGLNQLMTETAGTTRTRYTYDLLGNRKSEIVESGTQALKAYTYNYTNTSNKMQLTNYIESISGQSGVYNYDTNGNNTFKRDSVGVWDYIYNVKNQLVQVKKFGVTFGRYFYDANGLRYKKIEGNNVDGGVGTTTIYVYNGQSILFEETFNTTNQSALVTAATRELNVLVNGMNLAKYKGVFSTAWNYSLNYHLLDHLGSRQAVLNTAFTKIDDGEYTSFGVQKAGAVPEYSFTGKKKDLTGLVYFNARYYDSGIGRFTVLDPAKKGINFYIYCGNNPLKRTDPTGLDYVDLEGNLVKTEAEITNAPTENLIEKLLVKPIFDSVDGLLTMLFKGGVGEEYSTTVLGQYVSPKEKQMMMFGGFVGASTYLMGVAASGVSNAGSSLKIRSDISLSGGRSGQNVKNLLGPENSVVKGSNGRIFITNENGHVIWDITADRAKPVIPGKGFGNFEYGNVPQDFSTIIKLVWGGK